jgi:hypothetical protein
MHGGWQIFNVNRDRGEAYLKNSLLSIHHVRVWRREEREKHTRTLTSPCRSGQGGARRCDVMGADARRPCEWPSITRRCNCDRTTSEMRGLPLKIILGDSRRIENAQTHTIKHTILNMKFKLKLLQIKCHVLGFTKDKSQSASKDNQSFCGSVHLSR